MQMAGKKGYDLNRLILDLSGLTDEEIERCGRDYYAESMLDNAYRGIRFTHDEIEVKFWERRFEHGCFISPDKVRIDRARVARLPWILPLIAGNIPDSECWIVPNQDRPDNRLYLELPKNFFVWLEPRANGEWKYSTHYTGTRQDLRFYQRIGKCIWRF